MQSAIMIIFYFIIMGVCAPLIMTDRIKSGVSKKDIINDQIWVIVFILLMLLEIIFSSKINYTIALIIFLIIWLSLDGFLKSSKGKEIAQDSKFYKILAIIVPVVGILIELYFFITRAFGEMMFVDNKLQFKIFASISILVLAWTIYCNSNLTIKYIFKEEDKFKKVFVISEILLVIIYSFFAIYYIFNTNLLPF